MTKINHKFVILKHLMLQIKHINEQIVLGILNLELFSANHSNLKRRELERFGSNYVLKQLLKDELASISYHDTGKPFISNRSEFISISHSHDLLVLLMNKKHNTGCDVELIRDKVFNIRHKFLNNKELNSCNNDTVKLIIYWAAKETLYKIHGLKAIDFKENLSVEDFADNKIIGKITNTELEKQYLLHWEKFGAYILVYCLNEI